LYSKVWKKSYLIEKNLYEIACFDSFVKEIKVLLSKRKKNDIQLNAFDLLLHSDCWKNFDQPLLSSMYVICKQILSKELDIYITSNGNFTLKKNANKSRQELLVEILSDKGEAMHLSDLFERLKEICPDDDISKQKVKGSLRSNNSLFMRLEFDFFGLKEWNLEPTKTIIGCIVDFLSNEKKPQHADRILDYVRKIHSTTNLHSIKSMMSNEPKNRFVLFENNLYGLTSKVYPPQYILYKDIEPRKIEKYIEGLKVFLRIHDHFPFSSSSDLEEKSLHKWLLKIHNGDVILSEKNKIALEHILQIYCDLPNDIKTYNWYNMAENIEQYIIINRKLPSRRDNINYYNWLMFNKQRYETNKLSSKKKIRFEELIGLMNIYY
jgi:hypothetical protein